MCSLSAEVIVPTREQKGWGRDKEGVTVEVGPKTLGAKRETQGERSPSPPPPTPPPPPPRWSQGKGQGGDSSSGAPGSLAFTGGVCWSSVESLRRLWQLLPEPPAVTLHPAPQWIPSRTAGRRLHQAQFAPHSLEERRSRARILGTLGERWLSRPEVVGQCPDGVSQSAVGRRRPGRRLLTPGTPLIPPCFGEVGA